MPNNTLDKAIAAVPKFGDRISLFTKKLHLAQYVATRFLETTQKPTSFPIIIILNSRQQYNGRFISPCRRDEAYLDSYLICVIIVKYSGIYAVYMEYIVYLCIRI